MQLPIPVLNIAGSAELVGVKSEAGGDVTILIRGTAPQLLAKKELPLRLTPGEFARLLEGLQGVARDRAAAAARSSTG